MKEKNRFAGILVVLCIVALVAPFALGLGFWLGGKNAQPVWRYPATDPMTERVLAAQDPDPVPDLAQVEATFPSGMREGALGLYWVKPKGAKQVDYVKSTSPEADELFDPSKPMMIYFHGMALGTGATSDEDFYLGRYWLDRGYNTAIFNWSQFADQLLPWGIEPSIWGHEKIDPTTGKRSNVMAWTDERGISHTKAEENPAYSLTEIFAAYFYDFIKDKNFSGPEFRMTGLSMGGQMVAATSSYLVAKNIQGLLDSALIPDRVTMYDPYILGLDTFLTRDFVYCPWLDYVVEPRLDAEGNPVKLSDGNEAYYSTGEMIGGALEMMHNRGVALEYIPTTSGIVPGFLGAGVSESGGGGQTDELFYANTAVLEFNTRAEAVAGNEYYEFFNHDTFNMHHLAGREWYCMMLDDALSPSLPVFFDSAMQNTHDYSINPMTPTVYSYLRAGVVYQLDSQGTLDPADDVIASTNIKGAQVGGFAFEDRNANGKYDDRIQSRLGGVKVELYVVNGAEDRLIASAITDHTGAYLLDVPVQYANGFDQFYLKVYGPDGYQVTTTRTAVTLDDWCQSSTIGESGESARFTLDHQKALKVVNAGFTRAA